MRPRTLLKKYFNKLDIHTLEVYKKSSYSLIVKIFGMLAGLTVSIVLGRTIGSEGLGVISLVERLIGLILVLAMLGMNNVILKNISIAYENKDWQNVGNTLYTAFRINLPFALFLSILLILLSPWLANDVFEDSRLEIPLIICSAMVGVQVYSKIIAAGVNGFRKIWQSNLVNNSLSIVIVAIGLLCYWLFDVDITILNVVILYAAARFIVALTSGIYWRKLYHFKGKRQMEAKAMLKVALPLLIVASASIVAANADVIMLGWLSNSKEVGLYSVAARLGLLTNFLLAISISTLAPKIAHLYAEKKKFEIQQMMQKVTKPLIIIAVSSLLFFYAFGDYILRLWGSEFSESYWVLIIICVGQLFNISTGSTGVFLMMTGYERLIGKITFASAILNIILNLVLITKYGALGAAIATATVVIVENVVKVYLVKKLEGIWTIPFL